MTGELTLASLVDKHSRAMHQHRAPTRARLDFVCVRCLGDMAERRYVHLTKYWCEPCGFERWVGARGGA